MEIKKYTTQWPLLGATRFFLATIVAVVHLEWFLDDKQAILKISEFSGLVAVLGFLLISGYSIAASYQRQSTNYYLRRVLRIIPLYVLCVIGSALLPFLFGNEIKVPHHEFSTPSFNEVIQNLFFLQGITSERLNTNPIVWTLTIEVFFYIIAPVLVRHNFVLISMLVISSISFFIYRFLNLEYFSHLLYGLSILFLGWAWLLGFWLYHNKEKPWAIYLSATTGVVLISLNNYDLGTLWATTWVMTCGVIGYSYLVPSMGKYITKILNIFGSASYPLYLIHIPLFIILYEIKVPNSGVIYFSIVMVVSIFIDYVVDRPIKKIILNSIDLIKNSKRLDVATQNES